VGTRKARALLRADATVTVVSPVVSPELAARVEAGRVRWIQDTFRPTHLDDMFLVVAATADAQLNESITRGAVQRGALACNASSAGQSQVIFGALLDAGEATIAVFTDGRDPGQAARTRDDIADALARRGRPAP
jgi:siroheme synthase-like protein